MNLDRVLPASLIAFGIIAEMRCSESQLLGDKCAESSGRLLALLKDSAREAQVTKHQREARRFASPRRRLINAKSSEPNV